MSSLNENLPVQQATAEYLEKELGWDSVRTRNNEDFGSVGLHGRENYSDLPLSQLMNRVMAV